MGWRWCKGREKGGVSATAPAPDSDDDEEEEEEEDEDEEEEEEEGGRKPTLGLRMVTLVPSSAPSTNPASPSLGLKTTGSALAAWVALDAPAPAAPAAEAEAGWP